MSERAHPLAEELAERLEGRGGARVLLVGAGSGRNLEPFTRRGIAVDSVEPGAAHGLAGPYDAAFSSSGLLHGSWPLLRAAIGDVSSHLAQGAYFFTTLGSQRDPRFEVGDRIDARTWSPQTGSEAGVPHVYVSQSDVGALLDGFEILSAEERTAASTVGRWAHTDAEAERIVHWFVRARRRVST